MHFLGLAGLPRRIPDYPAGYSYWNNIMSLGTFLTILSLLFFLYLVFNTIKRRSYIGSTHYLTTIPNRLSTLLWWCNGSI